MGIFSDVTSKLWTSRHLSSPNLSPFVTPDAAKIARALQIEARAAADGGSNIPSSESEQPSVLELEIEAEIESLAATARKTLSDGLEAYSSILANCSFEEADVTRAITEGQRALGDVEQEIRAEELRLLNTKREMEEAERNFSSFRRLNRLESRSPSYPRHRVVNVLVLGLLLILETIINGSFFARGSEQGLIGGVIAASVLSAINLGLGFLAGLLAVRALFHSRASVKVVGGVGVGVWLVATFVLNLFIANYRDLFALRAGVVSSAELLAQMKGGLFGVEHTESLILFGLGCLLNLIAALDGFKLDDRHFEYGALDRKRRELIAWYEDAVADHAHNLAQHRDAAMAEISSALEDLSKKKALKSRSEVGRRALISAFERHIGEINGVRRYLTAKYREENQKARSLPPPERFQFESGGLMVPDFGSDSVEAKDDSAAVRKLEEALVSFRERWQELQAASAARIRALGDSGPLGGQAGEG